MKVVECTVYLTAKDADWVGEISFMAPKKPGELWQRVHDLLMAVQRKVAELGDESQVTMGLYLELDSVEKTSARWGFWRLMQTTHTEVSVTWHRLATFVPQTQEGGATNGKAS